MAAKTKPEDIQDSYNNWTVLDRNIQGGQIICRCVCGKEKPVRLCHLKSGASKDCGCGRYKRLSGARVPISDTYGLWEVIDKTIINNKVLCKCSGCEKEKLTQLGHLRSGESLGCIQCTRNIKHGLSYHPLYWIWHGIKQRCNNPNFKRFYDYGGRGITVCDEWNNSFESFYEWSINNGWQEELQIDRINNDGNYEPSNCRWVTNQQNAFNRGPNKNGTSKYKGVHYRKDMNKWVSVIKYNQKTICLGSFETEDEAALTYNEKARELFGEYANLNKVDNV